MIQGFRLYFVGMKYWLGNRNLVRLSFFPLVINISCVLSLMALTATKVPEFAKKFLPEPGVWYSSILYYSGLVILGGVALIASYFVASLLANLANIPFYDLLSEKTLVARGSLQIQGHGLSFWMGRTAKNIAAMAKKLVLIGILSIILIIMNLVPGLGILVLPLATLIITSDILDYSFDHYGLSFSQRMNVFKQNFLLILGFCAGVAILAAIPIVNLFIMPGQVVAGAVLVGEIKRRSPWT